MRRPAKPIPREPTVGEVRVIYRFAWLPVRVSEPVDHTDVWVWLEKYKVYQMYSNIPDGNGALFRDWEDCTKWAVES